MHFSYTHIYIYRYTHCFYSVADLPGVHIWEHKRAWTYINLYEFCLVFFVLVWSGQFLRRRRRRRRRQILTNSLFAIWGVDPLGLDPLPFKSPKIPKSPRSSCLTVVSPRGSNEAKETAGMKGFFLSKQCVFFGRSRWFEQWQPIWSLSVETDDWWLWMWQQAWPRLNWRWP